MIKRNSCSLIIYPFFVFYVWGLVLLISILITLSCAQPMEVQVLLSSLTNRMEIQIHPVPWEVMLGHMRKNCHAGTYEKEFIFWQPPARGAAGVKSWGAFGSNAYLLYGAEETHSRGSNSCLQPHGGLLARRNRWVTIPYLGRRYITALPNWCPVVKWLLNNMKIS